MHAATTLNCKQTLASSSAIELLSLFGNGASKAKTTQFAMMVAKMKMSKAVDSVKDIIIQIHSFVTQRKADEKKSTSEYIINIRLCTNTSTEYPKVKTLSLNCSALKT